MVGRTSPAQPLAPVQDRRQSVDVPAVGGRLEPSGSRNPVRPEPFVEKEGGDSLAASPDCETRCIERGSPSVVKYVHPLGSQRKVPHRNCATRSPATARLIRFWYGPRTGAPRRAACDYEATRHCRALFRIVTEARQSQERGIIRRKTKRPSFVWDGRLASSPTSNTFQLFTARRTPLSDDVRALVPPAPRPRSSS